MRNFEDNDEYQQSVINVMSLIMWSIAGLLVCFLFGSCATKKETVTETTDSTYNSHIEKVQGTNISSSNVNVSHWGERIHSIVLNEKGDTIREKEYVYVSDKQLEIYKDSLARLKESIDSANHERVKFIRYTIKEKLPWYKKLMMYYSAYVIVILLSIIVIMYIYIRYMLRKEQER